MKNNYKVAITSPHSSKIIFNLATTETSNTIYLIGNTSNLYLQVINASGLIANSSRVLITKVYPGEISDSSI